MSRDARPSGLRPRLGVLILAATMASGCAARTPRDAFVQPECEFRVINTTAAIVDVRLPMHDYSAMSIGVLNPGEAMTYRIPCAARRVFVMGIEVPPQVGAPRMFGAVYAEGDLVEGQRPAILLQWP